VLATFTSHILLANKHKTSTKYNRKIYNKEDMSLNLQGDHRMHICTSHKWRKQNRQKQVGLKGQPELWLFFNF